VVAVTSFRRYKLVLAVPVQVRERRVFHAVCHREGVRVAAVAVTVHWLPFP
jgi:hypothetical protein